MQIEEAAELCYKLARLSSHDEDGSENVAKKNEFASFQTSSRLFGPAQFVKCRAISPGVEFLTMIDVSTTCAVVTFRVIVNCITTFAGII